MHCTFYTKRRLRVRDSDGNKDKRMYVSLTPDQTFNKRRVCHVGRAGLMRDSGLGLGGMHWLVTCVLALVDSKPALSPRQRQRCVSYTGNQSAEGRIIFDRQFSDLRFVFIFDYFLPPFRPPDLWAPSQYFGYLSRILPSTFHFSHRFFFRLYYQTISAAIRIPCVNYYSIASSFSPSHSGPQVLTLSHTASSRK